MSQGHLTPHTATVSDVLSHRSQGTVLSHVPRSEVILMELGSSET